MAGGDVAESFRRSVVLDLTTAEVPQVRGLLADLGRVQSWIDARRVEARRRLDDLARTGAAVVPDQEIATAGRTTARDAAQNADRDKTLELVPAMEDALRDGAISGAHVDALGRGLRQLEPADRRALVDCDGARLARLATRQTPDEYAKTVKAAVADAQSDGGIANLERKRRATKLRWWYDQITGMLQLRGEFDPESALKLTGRLHNLVEELFHDRTPDTCPDDPSLKQDHLRALALIALVEDHTSVCEGPDGNGNVTPTSGGGLTPRASRPDLIVVVPLHTLQTGRRGQSIVDSGDPDAELPVETLRRIACTANVIPSVLDGHGVLRDLGRGSRLASKEQRRALRAMYPSCGIHGCRVPFQHCVIHHIRYWENLGPTDMANLTPRQSHRF